MSLKKFSEQKNFSFSKNCWIITKNVRSTMWIRSCCYFGFWILRLERDNRIEKERDICCGEKEGIGRSTPKAILTEPNRDYQGLSIISLLTFSLPMNPTT